MSAALLTSDVVLAVAQGRARLITETQSGTVSSMSVNVQEFERAVTIQLKTLVAMADDPKAMLERVTSAVVNAQSGDFPDAN